MRKLLTPLAIEKIEAGLTRREISDAGMPGLRLVIQPKPSGARSWCVRYRYGGRPRKLTLGAYPRVDLAKARQRTKDALEAIERGEDPGADKQAWKASQQVPTSDEDGFEHLVRRWLHTDVMPRTRRWRDVAGLFGLLIDRENSKPAKPAFRTVPGGLVARWAERPVDAIRRRDVIAVIDECRLRGTGIVANRVLSALGRFFAWCCAREIVRASPTVGLRKPVAELSRERVLTDDELVAIWRAAADGTPFGDLVRLLMLTGQRRAEVAGISWPEIDLVACTWTLPGPRTKNGRAHIVPLSAAAVDLLEDAPRYEAGDFLFGLGGETSFSGFSRSKSRLDAKIKKAAAGGALAAWTLHDIRRTVATRMADLGVMPHIVEAVLNHVSGSKAGVAGTYNRSLYEPEKRKALELWAKHVEGCVARAFDRKSEAAE
jgi:integrase